MPALMNRETSAASAALMIADGLARRRRRIWVPGWVAALHWLRALLHTPLAERELLRAAPEMEAMYLQGLAAEGAFAVASRRQPDDRPTSLHRRNCHTTSTRSLPRSNRVSLCDSTRS